MQMIHSGDNCKTQLLSQIDRFFFSAHRQSQRLQHNDDSIAIPNHSWWWPYESHTNRKETRSSAAICVSKQSKLRSSRFRVRVKTEHRKVLSHTTNVKKHNLATTTLKFEFAKCSVSISYRCRHSSGPRHPAPAQQDRATKSGNQQLWHVTHIWDQSLRAH